MKVVFLQDVKGVAKQGEVKEVADGYAQNFLLPKKLAAIASESAIKELQRVAEQRRRDSEKELHKTQELAGKLDGQEVVIAVKTNADGLPYAAIREAQIVTALKKQGYQISKSQVVLAEPIKEVGTFDVSLKFDHGLEAQIQIIIEESP